MEYVISSNEASAVITDEASEILSFKRKGDDYEYMWQGDPKYWHGKNPTLFPQISSPPSKTNTIYGKTYPMGNHGFARTSKFDVINVESDSITLRLCENEETLKQYPFKFEMIMKYKIEGSKLHISYVITNNSDKVMPFGFGLHPGFNTNLGHKDTYVDFECDEDHPDVINKRMVISDELFERQEYVTVIIKQVNSTYVTLHTNNHSIKVTFKGFPVLAMWSPKGPFLCIEPWTCLNAIDERPFEERPQYQHLNPQEQFKREYTIEFN